MAGGVFDEKGDVASVVDRSVGERNSGLLEPEMDMHLWWWWLMDKFWKPGQEVH